MTAPSHEAPPPDRAAADGLLAASLRAPTLFAAVCGLAGLDHGEAQVLALLAAVEVSPELQRLVGRVHGEPARRRLTLAALARL
ncbi:MAG: hypothetical protein JWO60_3332, partial [Frankiales bacterium]|nr:hypothetical protein [Frankiales bacterium]